MASIYLQKIPGNAASPSAASRWARCLPLGALILVTSLISGCASIFGTETETLPITSQPPDAQILITDEAGYTVFRGRTPDRVPLPKSDGRYFGGKTFSIAISKKGYATQRVKIDAQPNALYLGGNILAGGLIGWLAIDPTNGNMYELSKAGVDVTLQKLPEHPDANNADAPPSSPDTAASSSTADLRPPVANIPVLAPSAAAPVVPLTMTDGPDTSTASPSATTATATPPLATTAPPSIFVPERPAPQPPTTFAVPVEVPVSAAPELLAPLPETATATEPLPPQTAPPVDSRPPPPYWPAPPKLPVSPST